MNSHDVTIAGYAASALMLVGLQLRGYSRRSRIPPLGTVLSRVMRTRSGRVGVLAGWAWLGLHFFAR